MEPVLHIENVSKSLGGNKILHELTFDTYAGEVFGFLGPNGAGKTTLIKIIAGLLSLDEGNVTVCGNDLRRAFEPAMASIGGIVENPEFYPYLTGAENLRLFANMRDGVTDERIREVTHLVGLDNRIDEKVSRYSLGMRQRLGVAQAILHRPRLLILDEPTNGLDPVGIKDLRDTLKHLAHEEGVAVFVSSHLMSEMELMCDRVGVIVRGKLVSVQPIDELVAAVSPDRVDYVLRVSDSNRAAEILSATAKPDTVRVTGEGVLEIILPAEGCDDAIAAVNKTLIGAGIALYTVTPKENRKLEDVFLELIGKGGEQIA